MQIKKQAQGAAIAIALLSIGLTTLSAEAKPWKHKHKHEYRHDREHYDVRYDRGRYDDARYDRGRYDNGRYHSRPRIYYYNPGSYHAALPSGCRRVVVRQRAYYTPDNNVFFTYNPARNVYIVVNNPFRFF
jgi:hypothetical protein